MILWQACTPEEEILDTNPPLMLSFSTDTLTFDTVFTTIKTTTKRLSVRNPNDKAIVIHSIRLQKNLASFFSLTINGKKQNEIQNLKVLGKDSLLILIEAILPESKQNLPLKIEDELNFQVGSKTQSVKIVAWGQDAIFYENPQKKQVIDCNTIWYAQKPIVILDTLLLLESGCKLQIEAGARIHFGNESALYIAGTLESKGSFEKPIYFQSLRTDKDYAVNPSQWKAIFFLEGSKDNILDWTVIKNGQVGLRIGTPDEDTIPDVTISNSIIKNMGVAGVQAFTSDVKIYNSLIFACVENAVALLDGGNYELIHNTFMGVNVIPQSKNCNGFVRNVPLIYLTNYLDISGQRLKAPLFVKMTNNLIWGDAEEEVGLFEDKSEGFEVVPKNNLIRTKSTFWQRNGNILNINPKTKGKRCEDVFELEADSPAIDAGISTFLTNDLKNQPREDKPDIGAFEYKN
ncbi:MAG: hypothetical protein OHK0038_07290 [Flammeovirgaceae bacterium]